MGELAPGIEWNPVTYLDSTNPQKERRRQEWLAVHPDGEVIETDAFAGIVWIDNSVCVQQSLIEKGRLCLLRVLTRKVAL